MGSTTFLFEGTKRETAKRMKRIVKQKSNESRGYKSTNKNTKVKISQ